MPSKSDKQARLMRAVAHGWEPDRVEGPTKKVAREFVRADKKNMAEGGALSSAEIESLLSKGMRGELTSQEVNRLIDSEGYSRDQFEYVREEDSEKNPSRSISYWKINFPERRKDADVSRQRGGEVSKKRMARSLESSPRIPVEELDRIREALGQSPEQNALDKFVKNPRLPEGELEKLRELVESRQGMKRKNPRLPEDELEKLRELMKSGQGAERTNSSPVLSKEELAKLRDVISRSR